VATDEEDQTTVRGDCFPGGWPVLQSPDHDLDPVAAFVSTPVCLTGLLIDLFSHLDLDAFREFFGEKTYKEVGFESGNVGRWCGD
jgi:hypothetical protein